MADVTWTLKADLDRDGTYEEDLSSRITMEYGGLVIDRGLNDQGVYTVSQLQFRLKNHDGRFSPNNSGSGVFGELDPGIPVQIQSTHSAVTRDTWTGFIQRQQNEWVPQEVAAGVVQCTALDVAEYLRRYDAVDVLSSQSRRTDQAIDLILDEMGWDAGLRDLDTGQHTMPFHFVSGQQALAAIMDMVYAEMGGYMWITKSGEVRFESRAARLGLTVDRTWGDGTTIVPKRVALDTRADDLISTVQVQAQIFQSDQLEQEVYRFSRGMANQPPDSLQIAAKSKYEVTVFYDAPVLTLTAPVAYRDFTANDNNDGSGTDRTGSVTVGATDRGGRVEVSIANNHTASVYITAFRLRGIVQSILGDNPTFVSAKSIPGQPSDASASIQVPFVDDAGLKARDYSMQLLRTHRYPLPLLTLSFDLHDDATAASLLATEIGDLVYYKDTGLGAYFSGMIDEWWYVEAIRTAVAPNAITQIDVRLTPAYGFRNLDKIAFDLFTRADVSGDLNTSTSGDEWLNDSAWNIDTNRAKPNTSRQLAWVELNATDCVVEATLLNIATAGGALGVVYRVGDSNNYWRAGVYSVSGTFFLEKVVAGSTAGSPAASTGHTITDSHEIRVIVQGNRHRVWIDRKLIFDVTDSALNTNTKTGIYSDGATGTRYIDDFYAQGLVI